MKPGIAMKQRCFRSCQHISESKPNAQHQPTKRKVGVEHSRIGYLRWKKNWYHFVHFIYKIQKVKITIHNTG